MPVAPLTGQQLLDSVHASQGLSKAEQARAAGYIRTVNKGENAGKVIPDVVAFSNALLEAHGYEFGEPNRGKKPARGILRVGKSGALLIGPAYLRELEVQTGDEFDVKIETADGRILLELLEPAEPARKQFELAAA